MSENESANVTGSWREWLAAQRATSTMTAEIVPLAAVRGWGMAESGEAYCRSDGKFFRLVGARISVPKEGQREVPNWDQPMLEETGGEGAVVLVKARGEERFLIQAKAEPGNATPGCVLLAATIQASRANLERAHGGTRPPRAELLDGGLNLWLRLGQDGGRFFHKRNAFGIIEVDPRELTLNANERWCTRDELRSALLSGDLNEHLMLALFFAVL